MKTLFLLRHAEAAAAADDFARGLTGAGIYMAGYVADQLALKGLWPDKILCSAARRTRETVIQMLETWRPDMQPDVTYHHELYSADVDAIMTLLQTQKNEHKCIMIVGHNPTIHLAALALPRAGEVAKQPKLASHFPPASCVVMNFPHDDWTNIEKNTAALTDFFHP